MLQEYTYYVSWPRPCRTGGWQFSVASQRLKVHGPFEDRNAAARFRTELESRWRTRVAELGGRFRRVSATEWIVAVPADVPVEGLRRCELVEVRKGRDPRDDPPVRLRGGPWKIR